MIFFTSCIFFTRHITFHTTYNLLQIENVKSRNKRGRHKNDCWKHFEYTEVTYNRHAHATCKFCEETWYRGEKALMEGYLANYCKKALGNVIREYLIKANEPTSSNSNNKK